MALIGQREHWKSQVGVILASAGSAVGLGNFLRFPVQATQHGGGAFMIPYFISFILIGIPLAWVEWTMGRWGGAYGQGAAPGIFSAITGKAWTKYLGVIAIFGPMVISFYYIIIESWTLAYSVFSLSGKLRLIDNAQDMNAFLQGFQGAESNQFFSSMSYAIFFFLLTFAINYAVIYKGITRGIERVTKIAMPVLFFCALILLIRVLTLGTPDPAYPDRNVTNGLGFLWNPDFMALSRAKVWLAAAGQMFFTLSLGLGVLITYSSYLRKRDDVALSSLAAGSTNEFCEVILGGSIIIPVAFIYFGAQGAQEIAQGGAFDLGFVSMPLIFHKMLGGGIFGFLWFFLLFLAGVTSSISIIQPFVAFLEDEFGISRQRAVIYLGIFSLMVSLTILLTLTKGTLGEMDFWAGNFIPVFCALAEVILFGWIIGIDKGFGELNRDSYIRVPNLYKFVIKYIDPLFLGALLVIWFYQEYLPIILMKDIPVENKPYILATRIGLLLLLGFLIYLISRTKNEKRLIQEEEEGLQ